MSRRELSRREHFAEVSPELGLLDEAAFDDVYDTDPDAALALLADLTSATDERLRSLARRLAGRVVVDTVRTGVASSRGASRLRSRPMSTSDGDLDVDSSLDAIHLARAAGHAPPPEDLHVHGWDRPSTAVCLLVDRSGSMHGERLAVASVAAAAVALRAPTDCSVIAFAEDAVVVKAQDEPRSAEAVVTDLLRLRGHGVTNVALATRAAARQLARSGASRRVTVLLSDCRSTAGGAVEPDASRLDELVILAPEGDGGDAAALADALDLRWYTLGGPTSVTAALASTLERRR